MITVFRIFSPCLIFFLLYLQTVSQERFETLEFLFTHTKILRFAQWQRGQKGQKNKRGGGYFPAYSLVIDNKINIFDKLYKRFIWFKTSISYFIWIMIKKFINLTIYFCLDIYCPCMWIYILYNKMHNWLSIEKRFVIRNKIRRYLIGSKYTRDVYSKYAI